MFLIFPSKCFGWHWTSKPSSEWVQTECIPKQINNHYCLTVVPVCWKLLGLRHPTYPFREPLRQNLHCYVHHTRILKVQYSWLGTYQGIRYCIPVLLSTDYNSRTHLIWISHVPHPNSFGSHILFHRSLSRFHLFENRMLKEPNSFFSVIVFPERRICKISFLRIGSLASSL